MENILLDFAGTEWLGATLPTFSNGLNGNIYLADIQNRFISYLENRLIIQQLIGKLGGNVAVINWYKPVEYVLYVGNVEGGNFVGTLKQRKEMCESQGLTIILRMSILGSSENGIYIGVKEKDTELAMEVAQCLVELSKRDINVPKVGVIVPNMGSNSFVDRYFLREFSNLGSEKYTLIDIVFNVKDNSDFMDEITTGQDAIVAFISRAFDKLTERKIENG